MCPLTRNARFESGASNSASRIYKFYLINLLFYATCYNTTRQGLDVDSVFAYNLTVISKYTELESEREVFT